MEECQQLALPVLPTVGNARLSSLNSMNLECFLNQSLTDAGW